MEMSIRECSLRMGLFTQEEDDEGIWNEREIGPPKKTPGFEMQDAWELITQKHGGKFKTSTSKGCHIARPVLHFSQVFVGYNLLGQTSAALTTPELYFTWCMLTDVKVHLGYWLAYACNSMTSHMVRHLYTCHLLGAYLQRNLSMKVGKSVPTLLICDAPELFNTVFFFNKGLLHMKDGEVVLYELGKPDVVTMKKELEGSDGPSNAEREEWRREIKEVRNEISEVRREMNELRGNITGLTGNVTMQNEQMTEAIKVMIKMVASMERRFPLTQQTLPPRPSSEPKQLGPVTSSLKKA